MIDRHTHDTHHKKSNLVMWIFLGIIFYFLFTEHRAHIVPYLPWVLLALCPLMHIFMHGRDGHGMHDHHKGHRRDIDEDKD